MGPCRHCRTCAQLARALAVPTGQCACRLVWRDGLCRRSGAVRLGHRYYRQGRFARPHPPADHYHRRERTVQLHAQPHRRRKQHLAAALDKDEKGAVCDWIRGILRRDYSLGIRVIQEDINPKDLDLFEHYWIEQFPNLLNSDSSSRRKPTVTAQKIIEGIRCDLRSHRKN
jgi:hypothetical protein